MSVYIHFPVPEDWKIEIPIEDEIIVIEEGGEGVRRNMRLRLTLFELEVGYFKRLPAFKSTQLPDNTTQQGSDNTVFILQAYYTCRASLAAN
jgi:hypothetical protein